jgi:hypothetical protein
MVFVHDSSTWRDDAVTLLAEVVTKRTELTVVKIKQLQEFVVRVYEAAEAGTGPRPEQNKDAAA